MSKAEVFPFDRPYQEVTANLDQFVETVIGSLKSSFLAMPRGKGFLEYAVFEAAYETLKIATKAFAEFTPARVRKAVERNAIALIVVRTILGFTPPEWAYVTSERSGKSVSQNYARSVDRRIRLEPSKQLRVTGNVQAMIETACALLREGARDVGKHMIHRLYKADTQNGRKSVVSCSKLGVPYAMLLYERFLGRAFASHRDSISEYIGDYMEAPVEGELSTAGISYRKTKRAERVEGFEQAPDFIVPDEYRPEIVIEAKITEDDGTARDKVTRIQHLATLSRNRIEAGGQGFQVVACIDGRGFAIRRGDMKKMIRATKGKVFTLATLDRLVECTNLAQFKAT